MSKIDSWFSCPERRGKAVCQTENFDPHCIHCGVSVFERNDGVMNVYLMEDIFEGTPSECVIAHQVNCQGKMRSGVAKAIREKYPEVYGHYMAEYELGSLKLGYTFYTMVSGGSKFVANMCGQDQYGYDGKMYTSYDALRTCLEDVKEMALSMNYSVVLPYKIACVRGGGDWNGVVLPMIEEIFKGHLIATVLKEGIDVDGSN